MRVCSHSVLCVIRMVAARGILCGAVGAVWSGMKAPVTVVDLFSWDSVDGVVRFARAERCRIGASGLRRSVVGIAESDVQEQVSGGKARELYGLG